MSSTTPPISDVETGNTNTKSSAMFQPKTDSDGQLMVQIMAEVIEKGTYEVCLNNHNDYNSPADSCIQNLTAASWDNIAVRAGSASAASVKVRFNKIKRDLKAFEAGTDNTTTTPTAKPSTPKKKTGKGSVPNGSTGKTSKTKSDTLTTPSKVTKPRGRPRKAKNPESSDTVAKDDKLVEKTNGDETEEDVEAMDEDN